MCKSTFGAFNDRKRVTDELSCSIHSFSNDDCFDSALLEHDLHDNPFLGQAMFCCVIQHHNLLSAPQPPDQVSLHSNILSVKLYLGHLGAGKVRVGKVSSNVSPHFAGLHCHPRIRLQLVEGCF